MHTAMEIIIIMRGRTNAFIIPVYVFHYNFGGLLSKPVANTEIIVCEKAIHSYPNFEFPILCSAGIVNTLF